MAVGTAKHIIVVSATGTKGKGGLGIFIRLASVHLLRRNGRKRSISRPAQATVITAIAETIFIIGMLSFRVGVALRSTLVGKASAGNLSRVPFQGVFEGIRSMTVVAVFTAKRTIFGSWALVSIHVDSIVDGSGRSRRIRVGRNITSSCEGKVLKAAEGGSLAALTLTGIMLQPANVTAPVADSEDHLLHIAGHVVEVRAVLFVINYFFISLSHLESIATEFTIRLMEVNFDVEFLLRVDSTGASRHKIGVRMVPSDAIKKV